MAAVDLGAESGRVTAVSFDGARLDVRVVNRFGHEPRARDGLLRWDIDGLWASIRAGLAELAAGDEPVSSVGVDTWGVDYGLYDADGALADEPVSYRDPRNTLAMRDALSIVGRGNPVRPDRGAAHPDQHDLLAVRRPARSRRPARRRRPGC